MISGLLVALAEQLGIIVENYRLRQMAEEGAIIEERQRLARELHDAVTQSLFGVTLFARSSVDALEAGDFEKAAATMQEVEQNALGALKEMRLLLHQLQPLALEQGGLRQAIDSRLNQVERRLGIRATLAIKNGLTLPPRVEESVYRIITEALNNSLKYADAAEVVVSLREDQGFIRLEVSDNGRGFDLTMPRLGMGIKNMQERVAMLQGELTITSTPGQGTTICVDLPAEGWSKRIMPDLIRVLVVDDHTVVRKGLCSLLTTKYGLEVVGEAADGVEAVDKASELQPDLILMDLLMPRKNGLEAIIEIKKENPRARILVLTSFSDDAQIVAAIKPGAMSYVLKDASPDELIHTIRGVYMGKLSIPAEIMQVVLAESSAQLEEGVPGNDLTAREIDVLRQLALGRSNQEIAAALSVSTTTVRTHVSSILRKLDLENRTQAALYAIEAGFTASE